MDYQVFLANVFQVCEGGIVLLVSGLLSIALHKIAVYFNLNNEAKLKATLDGVMTTAVHSAEGWAELKDTAPTGSDKMDEAVKVARMLLTDETFKSFTDEQLKKLINAAWSSQINVPAGTTDVLSVTPTFPIAAVAVPPAPVVPAPVAVSKDAGFKINNALDLPRAQKVIEQVQERAAALREADIQAIAKAVAAQLTSPQKE